MNKPISYTYIYILLKVLFCMITEEQKQHYKSFIESHEANEIYNGKRNVLYGIDILRKICNHPDLLRRKQKEEVNNKYICIYSI